MPDTGPDPSTMLIALVILICFSAFFSASETAYSTCNKIRLKQMANRGNRRAEDTLAYAEDFDRLISTILVGNNIVNIAATTIATVLFTTWFLDKGPTISSIVMTVVVLIFGEITPKTLAKNSPDTFAMSAYPALHFIVIVLTPVTFIFNLWQKVVNFFFKNTDAQETTSEELITMIEEVEKEGSIEKEESELIQSAIEFSDVDIADIYTPRIEVVAIDLDDSYEEMEEIFRNNAYSRLPAYRNTIDNIVGFIHHRDFFELEEGQNVESILQTPVYLPLTTRISDALKAMQYNKVHLAVVCDEFGGTAGIITMEDIIEELVGEIWDEHDEVKEEIFDLEDGSYKLSGMLNIDEVFELFDMYEDDIYDSNTLSGWIIEINEKMPAVGEVIEFKSLEMEILEADDRKITWVRAYLNEKEDEDESEEFKNKSLE